MVFTAIDPNDIEVGDPVTAELLDLIRTNFDDIDSRVTTNAAAAANAFPIRFELLGLYGNLATPSTGLMYHRLNFGITLTGAIIMIYDAGSGGTTEIDIERSATGGGAYASVFSTQPSVASGGGDFATSSNAVISTSSFVAGDIFRFDLTSSQTGSPDGFELILTYTIT